MIEPRLSKGAGAAAADKGPPPEGTGRLPKGRDDLAIGRDKRGLVSCSEAAAAGPNSGSWSPEVQALALSDASFTPDTKHFPVCISVSSTTDVMTPATVDMMHFWLMHKNEAMRQQSSSTL